MAETRTQRIAAFLNSGVWLIPATRPETRRAIAEFLEGLPEEDFSIATGGRVMLVATEGVSTVTPYCLKRWGDPPFTFEHVWLGEALDGYPYGDLLRAVVRALTYAVSKVKGLGEPAAAQIAQAARDQAACSNGVN